MAYASKRSVSNSDYTKAGGINFLPAMSKYQRAYAAVIAEANHQFIKTQNVYKSSNRIKQILLRTRALFNAFLGKSRSVR